MALCSEYVPVPQILQPVFRDVIPLPIPRYPAAQDEQLMVPRVSAYLPDAQIRHPAVDEFMPSPVPSYPYGQKLHADTASVLLYLPCLHRRQACS